MDSREIIRKGKKLGLLIDSKTFSSLLSRGNKDAEKLLKYSKSKHFQFVRSPSASVPNELRNVPEILPKYDDNGNLTAIEIARDKSHHMLAFRYRMRDIEKIGEKIYNRKNLSSSEKESIILVFIQAVLNRFNDKNILITGNKTLLKYRLWFESHFPGCPLNVATVAEAKEIMDLFSKYQNEYYMSGNYTCNKGHWYWLAFRSKVPNFHVGDSILEAFSNRFVYLLMSVDEIGFQYYLGVNNDTMDTTGYHFNYFISLLTGIFDSLAIRTNNQYDLLFKGMHISLNPRVGKVFLKAVGRKNPRLLNHVKKYLNFIKLIYQLREVIIHREMLQKIGVEFEGRDESWKMNFFKVDGNIFSFIKQCGDKSQEYEVVTEWGIYRLHKDYFLEPFHFAKSATRTSVEFSNKYLELLGFTNYIIKLKKKKITDDFLRGIEGFERDNLGF